MYELNKIAFGSFLAQLRREKGMTQKELAACLYVSDKAVSKWERGEYDYAKGVSFDDTCYAIQKIMEIIIN